MLFFAESCLACVIVLSHRGWLLHDECRRWLAEKGSLQICCHRWVVLIPIDDDMSAENPFLEADGKIHMEEPPPVIHHLVSELVLIPGACVRACVRACVQLTTATVSGEGRVSNALQPRGDGSLKLTQQHPLRR